MQNDHVAGKLLDLELIVEGVADWAVEEAALLRVQVLLLGRMIDVGLDVFLLGPRPGLIGNPPVSRIDDLARPYGQRFAVLEELLVVDHLLLAAAAQRAARDGVCAAARGRLLSADQYGSASGPVALNIRLAVR
jgi:hypothetical protein